MSGFQEIPLSQLAKHEQDKHDNATDADRRSSYASGTPYHALRRVTKAVAAYHGVSEERAEAFVLGRINLDQMLGFEPV